MSDTEKSIIEERSNEEILIYYRDFVEQLAYIGVIKEAEALKSDIESGRLKDDFKALVKNSVESVYK